MSKSKLEKNTKKETIMLLGFAYILDNERYTSLLQRSFTNYYYPTTGTSKYPIILSSIHYSMDNIIIGKVEPLQIDNRLIKHHAKNFSIVKNYICILNYSLKIPA